MNVLIIEDEMLSAQQMTQYLTAYVPDARVVQVLSSIDKSLAWFAQNSMPDLILSDIELLDGNVFALYAQVSVQCPVIFITAYDQFLLQAFKGNGIAYLLKPFTVAQFRETLDKYQLLRQSFAPAGPGLSPQVVAELHQALRQNQRTYKQRFSVRMRNSLYILVVEDVTHLLAEEGIVFAVDKHGVRYPLAGTLTEQEKQLDPAKFFRINRSEVVNINYVEKIEPYFNNRLSIKLKSSAEPLITSAALTSDFRKWLES